MYLLVKDFLFIITMKEYATYIRVSTQKQGRSGLGLEAQRTMCANFVEQHHGEIIREFQDIESGTHRDRKGLWQAIDYCQRNNTPLVIAKLDRLARDVEFTFKVINTGIEIHFTDMPSVNTMILGVFAAVAQYERELTSERTKKALAVKKAQGVKLGAASDNYNITQDSVTQRAKKAGSTRTRRVLENRDVIALIRIMKNVFPKCNQIPEEKWCTTYVTTRYKERIKMLTMMRDYKEMDVTGKLFAKWDLSDLESVALQHKLASKMQTIIKILTKNED